MPKEDTAEAITEERLMRIAKKGAARPNEVAALIDQIATKISKGELLALEALIDANPDAVSDELNRHAYELAPELFTSPELEKQMTAKPILGH
jgi:hypothetical protein